MTSIYCVDKPFSTFCDALWYDVNTNSSMYIPHVELKINIKYPVY